MSKLVLKELAKKQFFVRFLKNFTHQNANNINNIYSKFKFLIRCMKFFTSHNWNKVCSYFTLFDPESDSYQILSFSYYFLVTFNPVDFKLEISKCMQEKIGVKSNDPLVKFKEPGLSVLQNAQHIISTYEKFQTSLEKSINYLCEHMLELVDLRFMPYLKIESFFSTFHTLYTKNDMKYFLSTMDKCGIEVNK